MIVWGWGHGPGRNAINPTNRAFLWDPWKAHGGLEACDPSTTNDPNGDGVSEPTLAGAIQFPVTLSSGASAGGVYVTMTSSDSSKATVSASIYFPQGATVPVAQPTVTGIADGVVTITASAFGYGGASGQVQVGSGGSSSPATTLSFSLSSFAIFGTATLAPTLTSTVPAPGGGLTVTLKSSNPSIASVPATVILGSGATTTTAPVTGVGTGSATITASVAGGASATIVVTVTQAADVKVTWYGACWISGTAYGITGKFQAMDYLLTTPGPVPVQATLFFAPNCDPSEGIDNMNDYDDLTLSTHTWEGFSHAPDKIPVSAMYWVGYRTQDGRCQPGSPCSGCVNYTAATPMCSSLP